VKGIKIREIGSNSKLVVPAPFLHNATSDKLAQSSRASMYLPIRDVNVQL